MNELLYGLTPQDYARAEQLGYTNESFNQLGAEGTRNALRNNTKFQPAVAAPSAFKQQQVSPIPAAQTSMVDPATGGMVAQPQMDINYAQDFAPVAGAGYGDYANTATVPSQFNYMDSNGDFSSEKFMAGTPEQQKAAKSSIDMESAISDMNRANSFDWMGAANTGMQGANLAMNIGLYGDKKDYYENVNKGLEQNLTNAQATHDNRAKQQTNLGSTFSRN